MSNPIIPEQPSDAWRDVPGYPYYEVTREGLVRNKLSQTLGHVWPGSSDGRDTVIMYDAKGEAQVVRVEEVVRASFAVDEISERLRGMRNTIAGMHLKVGWYEFFKEPEATTHIAYVGESGPVYIPEEGVTNLDFIKAVQRGRAFRLVREEDVKPPEEEWRVIPGFSYFEMSKSGLVRHVMSKELVEMELSPLGRVTALIHDDLGKDKHPYVSALMDTTFPELEQ